MKSLNLTSIFAVVIFVGACVLSHTHLLELFERNGYGGILAHIGTIICELMFLFGVTTSNPNFRTRVALAFGGLIVLYSNISFGLARGKSIIFWTFPNGMELSEIILCGGLIPCLVWVSEWVRSRNTSQEDEVKNENRKNLKSTTKTHEKKQITREPLSPITERTHELSPVYEVSPQTSQKVHEKTETTPQTSQKKNEEMEKAPQTSQNKNEEIEKAPEDVVRDYLSREGKLTNHQISHERNWSIRMGS
jgi:hypothetical protein